MNNPSYLCSHLNGSTLILIWGLLLTFINPSHASQPLPPPMMPTAEPSPSLELPNVSEESFKRYKNSSYAEADILFMQRNIREKALKALELYREYWKKNPKDAQAGWRLSMGCYFAGFHLIADDVEKKKILQEGRDVGLTAIDLDPTCGPCHYWTAINMALYSDTVGVFKMYFSLSEIQRHLWESIKVDPAFSGAGAYRILGLIEQQLPGILGGSNDRAKKYIEKAVELAPNEPMNYLFLARLLANQFGDIPAARAAAQRGLQTPKPTPECIESIKSLQEINDFLSTLPDPNSENAQKKPSSEKIIPSS